MTTEEVAGTGVAGAQALVRRLTGGGLYVRTGLLLLPQPWLGREAEIAARLNLGLVNYPTWRAAHLRPGERRLRYTADRLIAELDAMCAEPQPVAHLLVANLDLPVAALSGEERRKFWAFLQGAFAKRPRALLVSLPQSAGDLLPWDTELDQWKGQGRLTAWNL